MNGYQYLRALVGGLWNINTSILATQVRAAFPATFANVTAGRDTANAPDPTAVVVWFTAPLSPSEILALDALVAGVVGLQQRPVLRQESFRWEANGGPGPGAYRGRGIGIGAGYFMPFPVPSDASKVHEVTLWIIPTVTQSAKSVRVQSYYSDGPDLDTVQHQEDITLQADFVAQHHKEMNFISAFPDIKGGSLCSLTVTNVDATQTLYLEYTIVRYE